MPELPEVETTRRGLEPHLIDQKIHRVIIRASRLRFPIQSDLAPLLTNKMIRSLTRRGKYLLFNFDHGGLILHLGMSGVLRVLPKFEPPEKHDHVDFILQNKMCVRFRDPRRFGALIFSHDPAQHALLKNLGPEPFAIVDANYLFNRTRNRSTPIKLFIMDNHIITGVGNIYANEALFVAQIKPTRKANSLSKQESKKLLIAIKHVLDKAIKAGGTTLKDFLNPSGRPGYFRQELQVYGRAKAACVRCDAEIQTTRLGQRSTYWCGQCQS